MTVTQLGTEETSGIMKGVLFLFHSVCARETKIL